MATCAFFLDPEADITLEIEASPATPMSLSSNTRSANRPSMTNTSRALKYSQFGQDNFTLTDVRIGLPNLPHFENPFQIPAALFDKRPRTDFRTYPGCCCGTIFSVFMQLYVVLFQTQLLSDPVLALTRLLYGFICQKCAPGVRLSEIILQFDTFGFDPVMNALRILEEFQYVMRIHSLAVEPVYVSDAYAGSHLISSPAGDGQWEVIPLHFWIDIHGEIEVTLQTKVRIKTAELIDATPGIEVLELARKMSSLTVADLLLVCDALELDDVVYSVYRREINHDGLIDEEIEELVPAVDNPTLLYWIFLKQRDPMVQRITRRLYSTTRDHLHLALGLANVLGSAGKVVREHGPSKN
jgi:hypothetical protein